MLLLTSLAFAGPVALLALDGRGVDAGTAEAASDALRDALVADGRMEVEVAATIADSLGAGHEADLRKARERYAAGRKAWDQSDTGTAVASLTEAIRLHGLAGSAWTRRAELADAHWLLALCLLRDGRVLDGRAHLETVARLWPGYAQSRGTGSAVALKMFGEVEGGLARTEWTLPPDEEIAGLFEVLDAEWLVLGMVDDAGRVQLMVLLQEGGNEEIEGVVSVPVDALDEGWTELAAAVARATGNAPRSGGRSGAAVASRDEPEDMLDDPDFDDPDGDGSRGDPEAIDPDAPDARARDARVEAPDARGSPDARPVRIRERGSIRYDDRPVTARWWFWTGIVAVVGGSTAAAWVLAQPPEVVTVENPDVWSVTVTTP
jgi:hypothetical protein